MNCKECGASLDFIQSSRVLIKQDPEKEGLIELRKDVADISLGEKLYSQVRIRVGNARAYLKGMAVYSDNIPEGYDVVFYIGQEFGENGKIRGWGIDIDNEFDFSHDPVTNLYDSDNSHSIDTENKIKDVEKRVGCLISRVGRCTDAVEGRDIHRLAEAPEEFVQSSRGRVADDPPDQLRIPPEEASYAAAEGILLSESEEHIEDQFDDPCRQSSYCCTGYSQLREAELSEDEYIVDKSIAHEDRSADDHRETYLLSRLERHLKRRGKGQQEE